MRTQRWWMGLAAGTVLGLGGVIVAEQMDTPANAAPVTLSAGQLQINQRISQAAVRRSNESLDLLDPIRTSGPRDTAPGWGTAQIRDGVVTAAKLEASLRERLPRWAVVEATSGTLVRGRGAVSAAKLATVGRYSVTFDRDLTACSYVVGVAPGGTDPVPVGQASAWRSSSDARTVVVRVAADDDTTGVPADSNTVPFHLQVSC